MRFKVDVTQSADGWDVHVLNASTGQPVAGTPRRLRRVEGPEGAFPQPTDVGADGPCAYASDCRLCTTTDVRELRQAYVNIRGGAAEGQSVANFGCYLFQTLLGESVWEALKTAGLGSGRTELSVTWRDAEEAINQLPWEMMKSPDGFVAGEAGLTITRRIAEAKATVEPVASPPRALFVVGTRDMDEGIRPGAEYLGLLRCLEQSNLGIRTHLLLRATAESLRAAIGWFRPAVLHFLCHGDLDSTRTPYLRLVHPDRPDKPDTLYARSLARLLEEADPRPQIVVLSACHTGSIDGTSVGIADQMACPFAVELVRRGTPIVLGMAGQVADQACRLFTRRFYEALLRDGEVGHAAAQGRRAGILKDGLTDPTTSVDWALPTLFLSEEVQDPALPVETVEKERVWQAIVRKYPCPSYPPFCDRLEALQLYDRLMADPEAQRAAWGQSGDLQVVAVDAEPPVDAGDQSPQFGRTRLLQELTLLAIRDGHVPCIVGSQTLEDEEWPRTLEALCAALQLALMETKRCFGLPHAWEPGQMLTLDDTQKGGELPAGTPDEIATLYKASGRDPWSSRVRAVAFRLDLLDLLEEVRKLRPTEPTRTRLLLLVDDVHRMDEAAGYLVKQILGPHGLRAAPSDVRVVLTHVLEAGPGEELAVNDHIRPWLENPPQWVERLTLGRFRPVEDRLAYMQFLLRYKQLDGGVWVDRPLTVVPHRARQPLVDSFFRFVRTHVGGVPSNLQVSMPGMVDAALQQEAGWEILQDADDEAALEVVEQAERGLSR